MYASAKRVSITSDSGLSPIRRQAIIINKSRIIVN